MSVVEQYIELLVQMGVPREDAVRFIAYHTENLNIWNKYKAEADQQKREVDEELKHLRKKLASSDSAREASGINKQIGILKLADEILTRIIKGK